MILKMGMFTWNNSYANWINHNYTTTLNDSYISVFTEEDNKSVNKQKEQRNKKMNKKIKKIILNNPATVIFWNDNSKTVVKCTDGDKYNPLNGIAIAFMKGMLDKKAYNKLKKAAETENTIVLN